LAWFVKNTDIECLIIYYNSPFYGIRWKTKKNILRMVDLTIIIVGLSLLALTFFVK
jgi:hypothetical protein